MKEENDNKKKAGFWKKLFGQNSNDGCCSISFEEDDNADSDACCSTEAKTKDTDKHSDK